MAADLLSMELTRPQFEKIGGWVYSSTGIKLGEGKEGLVKSRLLKRLRLLNLEDFNRYLEFVENDSTGREITAMIDALTTNKTSFSENPNISIFCGTEFCGIYWPHAAAFAFGAPDAPPVRSHTLSLSCSAKQYRTSTSGMFAFWLPT